MQWSLTSRLKHPLTLRRVVGNSMSPTLTKGELVWFTSLLRPKPNTIVLAKVDDLEVVKRLMVKENTPSGELELAGDNKKATKNYDLEDVNAILGRKLI
jgi:phage repressor protein C with HTH and peptisase S24 domain